MVKGYRFSGISSGIKKNGNKDLGLIFSEKPAVTAAVFTTNKVKAAPVIIGMERVSSGVSQAVIVNSGNANCCTGKKGFEDAYLMAGYVSDTLGVQADLVIPSSTGVIGEPLPMEAIGKSIPELCSALHEDGIEDFAESILTTDTKKKIVSVSGESCGEGYTITGVAKGSGMIRPDMATMLSFIMTDASIEHDVLRIMLKKSVDRSFNRITVDGDTSTNDTVVLLSNGCSKAKIKYKSDIEIFRDKLDQVTMKLARMVVEDGEGVTKFVEIVVTGAGSLEDAKKAAFTIAESSLVKTAIFGEDPNWGRIFAAAGRAGISFDPDMTDIYFDDVKMVEKGLGFGSTVEKKAAQVMKKKDFLITVNLNGGSYDYSVCTCDFSYDYVKINADYRS